MTASIPKNTICLWYDKDAEAAARFYAQTFPDSKVGAVQRAPGDFPGGKEGQVLTVEFTVLGIPCLGLNGGPVFKQSEAFSFQIATAGPGRNRSLLERDRRQRRPGEPVRLVQGQMGTLLADHAGRAHPRHGGSGSCRAAACFRLDDDDGENRRRGHRGCTTGRVTLSSPAIQQERWGTHVAQSPRHAGYLLHAHG